MKFVSLAFCQTHVSKSKKKEIISRLRCLKVEQNDELLKYRVNKSNHVDRRSYYVVVVLIYRLFCRPMKHLCGYIMRFLRNSSKSRNGEIWHFFAIFSMVLHSDIHFGKSKIKLRRYLHRLISVIDAYIKLFGQKYE